MDRELPIRKGNVVQATHSDGTVYNVLVHEVRNDGFWPGVRGTFSIVGDHDFVSSALGLFPFDSYTIVVLG